MEGKCYYREINPGEFDDEKSYYPKVLNSTLHPIVKSFLNTDIDRIIKRYTHLNPSINSEKLKELLNYSPTYFNWGGSDLFTVTNKSGIKQNIIIETNSCPSGQKSMPTMEFGKNGYTKLMETFIILSKKWHNKDTDNLTYGVIYDKNPMEAISYAQTLSDLLGVNVHCVEYYDSYSKDDPPVRWVDGWLEVKNLDNKWIKIDSVFRYVTKKPWNRIPIVTKTFMINPIICCLAGGRNKLTASKAYDILNQELLCDYSSLQIRTPETNTDVNLQEIPMYVKAMGYKAVVKSPYGNAGQAVWTIINEAELNAFMITQENATYDKYIIQSLVGNSNWSSITQSGICYHVGTVPDKKNNIYVVDIRMMVYYDGTSIKPLAIYARRADKPLPDDITNSNNSWDYLGTNLSINKGNNVWDTDTSRLILMDEKDFNKLGISIDDLIDAYIQTCLSVIAIDKMACNLLKDKDTFDIELFKSLNDDDGLINELIIN